MAEHAPVIVPIASGKGGVGKSFVTANLAMALAASGYRTAAVDLDLGCANLHSFFGLPNRFPGIGDFLKGHAEQLEELLMPLDTPDLLFLPGDGRTPFLANITYSQKKRLVSELRKLPVNYILLDLGAGATFNTLDFFRLSSKGFLVTTPEYPSIMNMLSFLKQVLLREVEKSFAQNQEVMDMIAAFYRQSATAPQSRMDVLGDKLKAIDPDTGDRLAKKFKSCRPRIIFNMGEDLAEVQAAAHISATLKTVLSVEADYFGFILEDAAVRRATKGRTAFFVNHQDTPTGRNLERIAARIVKFWDQPVQDSDHLLMRSTQKIYEPAGWAM